MENNNMMAWYFYHCYYYTTYGMICQDFRLKNLYNVFHYFLCNVHKRRKEPHYTAPVSVNLLALRFQ